MKLDALGTPQPPKGGNEMVTTPQVRKMPLNRIGMSIKQKESLTPFFVDILERHVYGGYMHEMLLEAYVLGFHHCLTVASPEYKKAIELSPTPVEGERE